ncbi:nucleoside-diphosphate kinase [Tianweitania sediminis]|uniref:Nucleoside-diphosphate kinase n=1 Tax=Tianweitania sediminis TaxID=1502156 RepID=A0A8J7UGC2_9HYPH|nr:nucleoside-diphosphate kinase [Tianweitania sediminis]MBP0438019.1 nucleoside-diphosphate kinase [Tianweitania sediminis]
MKNDACLLTTKDFTVLEVMLDRCMSRSDPLVPILNRKIRAATIVIRDQMPENVATLGSRLTFSVNGRDPDTRIVCHDRMTSPIGLYLPISTGRGLALLGLEEGQEFVMPGHDGAEERIRLHQVHYQPEAARRERDALEQMSTPRQRRLNLRVIQGALRDPDPFASPTPEGFDDPGPSAA